LSVYFALAIERCIVAGDFGARLNARLWGYLGFAATSPVENLRPDQDDLDELSDDLRSQLEGAKPEREWVAELSDSEDSAHPEAPQVVHLTVDGEGAISLPYRPALRSRHRGALKVGQLPIESAELLLAECDRAYREWRARYPDVGALAQQHGGPSGTRLYDYPSLRDKWCELHDCRTGS